MSKLLSSVLDKVSENNNEYRLELKSLNKKIDEKTTALVGDVVTLSNYVVDFSNAVTTTKEMVTNPISRIVESYVIKDLRSVETVNEQFVEKINDKIEGANINTKEEQDNFVESLNTLLNDKYLEIVRIKRVDFLSIDGTNSEIESVVLDFNNYLIQTFNFSSQKLTEVLDSYKKDIYGLIESSLLTISKIYLNNFVSEVSSALSATLDYDFNDNIAEKEDDFKPYIPEIPAIPEIETIDATNTLDMSVNSENNDLSSELEIPDVPSFDLQSTYDQINESYDETEPKKEDFLFETEEVNEKLADASLMDIPTISPIEIVEEPKEESKRKYDVEEILKIAKSPVVTMPDLNEYKQSNDYLTVNTFNKAEEKEIVGSEFDEKEIVEEMIRRLTKRLELINERQAAYEDEKSKIEQDEAFVNDLIENSNNKKEELDRIEEDLNKKEIEIEEKQIELNRKLNDVLPFANAIMKEDSKEA